MSFRPVRRRTTRLAVEIAGAGRHPGAWRRASLDLAGPPSPAHTVGLVRAAANRAFDLALLPAAVAQPDGPPLRQDAIALATHVAPAVGGIGLVAQADPASGGALADALAQLDVVSGGRAGWEPTPVGSGAPGAAGTAEALDAVDRLWFPGGAGRAPTPLQDRPLVVMRGDDPHTLQVAARRADVVRIAAPALDAARAAAARVRAAVADAGRDPEGVVLLLDVEVHTGPDRVSAEKSLSALDRAGGELPPSSLRVVGPGMLLADLIETVLRSGAADGVTFLPLALPTDLDTITGSLVPVLAGRGLFRPRAGGPLRSRFTPAPAAA